MEKVNKIMEAVMRGSNNNMVINTFMVGAFGALTIRSFNQQQDIETLEAEKDSLLNSNKAMKKSMWDWKQQLYAEATADNAPVPLARIREIYGEAPIPPAPKPGLLGPHASEGSKPPTKFVV